MAMCEDGGLLMLGSSVYRKRGYMYRRFTELHGRNDAEDVCWFAPSATMNPRLPQHVVDRALASNTARARAEFNNIWREDLSDFIPLDVIEACTERGAYERAPLARTASRSTIRNYRVCIERAQSAQRHNGTLPLSLVVGDREKLELHLQRQERGREAGGTRNRCPLLARR
jgi:hypothetical protein